jgi:ABC-2 type transport system ATP-binding protein
MVEPSTAGIKVRVQDLVKNYGPVRAVRGVGFEVGDGEIFGLLGPNGAGKTTTIECVLGLRRPDGGRIEVCGIDAVRRSAEVKQRIGAALQSTALQDQITVREALRLFSSFYRRKADAARLLERFALAEKADSRYEALSGGQRQRLAIALALVNEPEVLLLDEPTAGLDPQSRRELHAVVRQMRGEGRTVLLTTHYIEEAEQLCDRVAVIDYGRIIALGTPAELVASAKATPKVVFRSGRPAEPERVRSIPGVIDAQCNGVAACTAATTDVGRTVIGIVNYLQSEGNELLDLHVQRPSLEDVFIELTGRSLRE